MQETKDLLTEIDSSLARFSQEWPEQMSAFTGLMKAVEKPGALDTKSKELISLAVAIAGHCSWCIAFHVRNALTHGATKEEVMEASWQAVQMGGGPSLMYMQLVQKALDDLSA
jgi:AhpD family alkylhydroperoxidase